MFGVDPKWIYGSVMGEVDGKRVYPRNQSRLPGSPHFEAGVGQLPRTNDFGGPLLKGMEGIGNENNGGR